MNFTPSQLDAIKTRKGEVLVAAAAGSGKTAVLIERIITLMLEDKVPITEIVVLTFTNAAAAQMKNRLRIRLSNIIHDESYSAEERKTAKEQLLYLPLAYISTFHAFCIRILRNNYEQVNLDPGFVIGDENEMALLKQEALNETLDFFFEQKEEKFMHVVNSFVTTTRIQEFRQIILQIFERSRAFAHPDKWKEEVLRWFQDDEKFVELQQKYQDFFVEELKAFHTSYIGIQQKMIGFEKHEEVLFEIINELGECIDISEEDLAEGFEVFEKLALPNWPRIATDNKTGDTDAAHEKFNELKKRIKLLQKEHYTSEEIIEKQKLNLPVAEIFIELITDFEKRFLEKKEKRSILDFSDIEHKMIALLEKNDDIRKNIASQITEILVDEYQDTNETQDTILYALKRPENRIFMVGDVKQSIYRFRLADPTIFLEKEQTFSGENQKVIYLNQNFRSNAQVLDAINQICYELLRIDITYNEDNQLYYGNTKYDKSEKLQTTWHFFNRESLEGNRVFNEAQSKAKYVANEIVRILHEDKIYDMKTDEMRAVKKSDIAILYRNRMTDLTSALEDRLDECGIAYNSSTDRGYFEAVEVLVVLSMLQVLDNPYQNIELISYMRSPIGGFTDAALAEIRQHPLNKDDRTNEFYTYIQNILADAALSDTPLYKKLIRMEEELAKYRDLLAVQPIAKVLQRILEETAYMAFVAGLPYGQIRVGNLKMLVELAQKRTEYGVISLRSFNRYIKNLQRHKKDFAIAKEEMQEDDAIEMMTIHGSKGLEFPIVFFIDVDKQFNKADSRSSFQITKEEGLAFRYTDVKARTRERTWHYDMIANKQSQDDAGEEMRILYVALTRAEQQLHIFLDEDTKNDVTELTKNDLVGLTSFGDGLRYAFRRIAQNQLMSQENETHCVKDVNLDETRREQSADVIRETVVSKIQISDAEKAEMNQRFLFEYDRLSLQNYPQKQTVSEIKRMRETRNEHIGTDVLPKVVQRELKKPQFMVQKEKLTPQEKGTLYHLILEQHGFDENISVEEQVEMMVKNNFISEAERKSLDISRLQKVVDDIKERYIKNGYIIFGRELAFSMTTDAQKIYRDENIFEEEQVAIQGKIDLLLQKDEHYIVVDFKTDAVTNENSEAILLKRYEVQLALYKEAVERKFQTKSVATKIYPIMSNF